MVVSNQNSKRRRIASESSAEDVTHPQTAHLDPHENFWLGDWMEDVVDALTVHSVDEARNRNKSKSKNKNQKKDDVCWTDFDQVLKDELLYRLLLYVKDIANE